MPEDKTTIIIDTLKRLEQKADVGEARHLDLITKMGAVQSDVASLKARLDAMEKADQREIARQSEDRGGARAWIGTVVSAVFSLIAVFLSLTHRK